MDVLCAERECTSFTRGSGDDLRRVAALVEREPLRGQVTLPSGQRAAASLDGPGLAALVLASDFDPLLAVTLPAALRRAAQGRPEPLLRAAWALQRNVATARALPATDVSAAARVATLCSGASLPWSATTPATERPVAALSFAEQLGSEAFSPFGARSAASGELLQSCAEWPSSGRSLPAPLPLPEVPALILSGTADLRSTTEDARALAAQLPRGRLTVIDNAPHGVVDYGPVCPTRAVERFLASRAIKACDEEARGYVLPPPPRTFGDLPTRGMPPRVGRTVSAVLWTAFDIATAFSQRAVPALDRYSAGERRRGLRMRLGALLGGSYVLGPTGIHIRRARVVPGVTVSGHVRLRRVRSGEIEVGDPRRRTRVVLVYEDRVHARLRLRGRAAARGWLELRRLHVLVGRLGGRRVRYAPDWREVAPALEYWSPSLLRHRAPDAGPTPYSARSGD